MIIGHLSQMVKISEVATNLTTGRYSLQLRLNLNEIESQLRDSVRKVLLVVHARDAGTEANSDGTTLSTTRTDQPTRRK